jgi:hypothetical protein
MEIGHKVEKLGGNMSRKAELEAVRNIITVAYGVPTGNKRA